ncbi:hypothetical protein [Nostoc commune]|uniref:hypothetical protein n=1 Tax=Nostoc commune TaxID=1178 RepID=UPI0018C50A57|nr:hypothetical protein [Nostoc commune]
MAQYYKIIPNVDGSDRFANTFAKNRGSLAFAAKTSPCWTIKHFCQTPVQTHRTL